MAKNELDQKAIAAGKSAANTSIIGTLITVAFALQFLRVEKQKLV